MASGVENDNIRGPRRTTGPYLLCKAFKGIPCLLYNEYPNRQIFERDARTGPGNWFSWLWYRWWSTQTTKPTKNTANHLVKAGSAIKNDEYMMSIFPQACRIGGDPNPNNYRMMQVYIYLFTFTVHGWEFHIESPGPFSARSCWVWMGYMWNKISITPDQFYFLAIYSEEALFIEI